MTTNEFERLERDMEAAFAVDVPELAFDVPQSERPATHRRFAWRAGAVAGIAAAAILGAVLVAPNFGGDGPKVASAEELIQRSIAASDALAVSPTNYHMISVARSLGFETTTETWFGGADRFRVGSVTRQDGGEATVDGTAMVNGEMWLWQGSETNPVVAHGPATISVQPAPRPITVAQHLSGWNDNGCYKAEVTGNERLIGREAHVISVTATPESCPFEPKPLQLATIYVDVETELPLKMVYESSQPEGGSSFEVTRYETFSQIEDSALAYTPPAGTDILEFNDAAQLKQLLSNIIVYMVPQGSRVILDRLPQSGSEPATTVPD